MCPRCTSPDWCRALRCPTQCGGMLLTQPGEDAVQPGAVQAEWACTVCGPPHQFVTDDKLCKERWVEAELAHLNSMMEVRMISRLPSPEDVEQLIAKASAWLSPVHWTIVQILGVQMILCGMHAVATEKALADQGVEEGYGRCGRPGDLRFQAAWASLRAISICECIAAGCGGGVDCTVPHPIVHECASNAFFAGQQLLRIRREIPGKLALVVVKYANTMRTTFGKEYKDVGELECKMCEPIF